MKVKLDKKLLMIGVGAGVGVILPRVLKKYYNVTVPVVGQYLPVPWNTVPVFVPLVVGIGAFSIAQFTHLIKKPTVRDAVWMFGFTSLIAGLAEGIINPTGGAYRAPAYSMAASRPAMSVRPSMPMSARAAPRVSFNGMSTPTYKTGQIVTA